ncbi:MAG: hypothetical protein WC069_03055 [Candidatus Shapirobacteria bacterium]
MRKIIFFGSSTEGGRQQSPPVNIIETYNIGRINVRYSFEDSVPLDLYGLVIKPGKDHALQHALNWPDMPGQAYQMLKNDNIPFCIYDPSRGTVTEQISTRSYHHGEEIVHFATEKANFKKMAGVITSACDRLNQTANGILELKRRSGGIDQQIFDSDSNQGKLDFSSIEVSY